MKKEGKGVAYAEVLSACAQTNYIIQKHIVSRGQPVWITGAARRVAGSGIVRGTAARKAA